MSRKDHITLFANLLSILLMWTGTVIADQPREYEFIRDGGFELGILDMDIVRSPRYPRHAGTPVFPARDAVNPLSGNYSLRLPGLSEGDYQIFYRAIPLAKGENYLLSFDLRIPKKSSSTSIRMEVFNGWHRAGDKRVNLKPGNHHLELDFTATANHKTQEDPVFFIRLGVKNSDDIWLDNVSLRGPACRWVPQQPGVWIEPDRNMAVYSPNDEGKFNFIMLPCKACSATYRISNPLSEKILKEGELETKTVNGTETASIPLILSQRGFYQVIATVRDSGGVIVGEARHTYVVINPENIQPHNERRFGAAMEEHGRMTRIDAFATPAEYYDLAQKIGVGSVRIFSLTMPDIVSRDGIRFDFSQADAALKLMEKNHLEPMIVLGNNLLERTATWLRNTSPGKNRIDLRRGLHTPRGKKQINRLKGSGFYLDLDKYRLYLEDVFSHFKGRVKYYEIWNEPGHKFLTEDFMRIAELTRKVQQKIDPDSFLLGYSSTRRGQLGAGEKDSKALPAFLHEVQRSEGIKYIDILSYHSEHAFPFMHRDPDHHNHETGYLPRLRKILEMAGRKNLPIWDSERGIPWMTPHRERFDYMAGKKRWKHARPPESVFDVARQMPMVYAAAFANDVERLFWFYLESSSGTIQRAKRRWGFFDAQREPMPQIPVYNAMTEILHGARFSKLVESDNGGRAYIFRRGNNLIILAYNWREKPETLNIRTPANSKIQVLDTMGNLGYEKNSDNINMDIDSWPKYILVYSQRADISFLKI